MDITNKVLFLANAEGASVKYLPHKGNYHPIKTQLPREYNYSKDITESELLGLEQSIWIPNSLHSVDVLSTIWKKFPENSAKRKAIISQALGVEWAVLHWIYGTLDRHEEGKVMLIDKVFVESYKASSYDSDYERPVSINWKLESLV